MSGKLQIYDSDLLEALTTSFEPRLPARAVTTSKSSGVRFLLERGILSKGYDSTILCDKCERGCELPVEAKDGKRCVVCPTGFVERPMEVSADDISIYQFDFSAFCREVAKHNGLKPWADDSILGRFFHAVARGRIANKRITVIYTLGFDARESATTIPAIKNRIQCNRLVVIAPLIENLEKTTIHALATQGIDIVALDTLLANKTFDLGVAGIEETPQPVDSHCKVITHKGTEFLKKDQYEAIIKNVSQYDMFIDGFHSKAWKRLPGKKTVQSSHLTPAEYKVSISYIEQGKVAKPMRFGTSIKVFMNARKKIDIKTDRYDWRAFSTHRTPSDQKLIEFQFAPPPNLKFCVIIPLS